METQSDNSDTCSPDLPDEMVSKFERIDPGFNRHVVHFMFVTISAMILLGNIDHGIFPAASLAIKSDIGLNNSQYGMLGSTVFGGLVCGK